MSVRPSSDVVLLLHVLNLIATRFEYRENNCDSDVVPESNQIQDLLKPRNNSPPDSPWDRNPAKEH